jgi:hypothetical protein
MDSMTKKTTGKATSKLYRCQGCGHESQHSTNHYGEFYDRCRKCSDKGSPFDAVKTHECLEPLSEGWERPAPWKKVKLGDVIKFGYQEEA